MVKIESLCRTVSCTIKKLVLGVLRLDNAIHWINHYLVEVGSLLGKHESLCRTLACTNKNLGIGVQRLDNACQRRNDYPVDNTVCFVSIFTRANDLSDGQRYPLFGKPDLGKKRFV